MHSGIATNATPPWFASILSPMCTSIKGLTAFSSRLRGSIRASAATISSSTMRPPNNARDLHKPLSRKCNRFIIVLIVPPVARPTETLRHFHRHRAARRVAQQPEDNLRTIELGIARVAATGELAVKPSRFGRRTWRRRWTAPETIWVYPDFLTAASEDGSYFSALLVLSHIPYFFSIRLSLAVDIGSLVGIPPDLAMLKRTPSAEIVRG